MNSQTVTTKYFVNSPFIDYFYNLDFLGYMNIYGHGNFIIEDRGTTIVPEIIKGQHLNDI